MARELRKIATAALIMAATACNNDGSDPGARVEGLLRSPTQFVTAPGRCAFALIFDSYQLAVPVAGKGINPPRLITVAGGSGLPVSVEVRGSFIANSPATARIQLTIDGKTEARSVTTDENGFAIRFQGRLSRGKQTDIALASSIAPAGTTAEEALLQIETVDITLTSGSRTCDGT